MSALRKFGIPVVLVVVVIAISAFVLMNRPESKPSVAPANNIAQVTATPMSQPSPTPAPTQVARASVLTVKAIGNLLSENQASLSFQVAGRIKTVSIKEGDKVKANQVLATLDTGTLETQVLQAQALSDAANLTFAKVQAGPTPDDIALAKSNLDRTKAAVDQAQAAYDRIGGTSNPFIAMTPQSLALQQATQTYQGAIAQFNLTMNHPTMQELATAAAQVAQAQLALDQAKQTLVNAKLIAPIDGTVVVLTAKAGEGASVGASVATIADLSKMQVVVNVDENSLAYIKVGQKVNLTLDALGGRALAGKVRKIGLLAATATNVVSVPVTVDIDPSDALIYPGLSATVEFQIQ